ncbi:MAG: hypothetical protein MK008_11740 [Bdellovibrionales bacterium]|nr:hypothetical protein [Bdellovibrionales bacterium]
MKKIIFSLIILFSNTNFAQGPEPREEGFSIDALLTGFAESIEGYKIRTSIKISELDQINTNFSNSFLDLLIKTTKPTQTEIIKFEDQSLHRMNQSLELGESNLLYLLNLKILAQIPYLNAKDFILNSENSFISPRFFEFYPNSFFDENYLTKIEGEKPLSPQYVSGSLRFLKEKNNGNFEDHHLKILLKSKINESLYELTNCSMTGLLLPVHMHLFYKLQCDYKLVTGKYESLMGNNIKEGAVLKGFVDLNGELDPALYESNINL